jgi:hypothetical protein
VKVRTTRLVATIALVIAAPSLGAQPAPIPTSLGVTRALGDTRADAVATVDAGQVVSQPTGISGRTVSGTAKYFP